MNTNFTNSVNTYFTQNNFGQSLRKQYIVPLFCRNINIDLGSNLNTMVYSNFVYIKSISFGNKIVWENCDTRLGTVGKIKNGNYDEAWGSSMQ